MTSFGVDKKSVPQKMTSVHLWFVFLKSQINSSMATLVDFFTFLFFFKILGVWYLLASILGNIFGGVFHFSISRVWVFNSRIESVHLQASKYFLISAASSVLNSGFIYFLREQIHFSEVTSKITSALLIGIAINFPLFKNYVFKAPILKDANHVT